MRRRYHLVYIKYLRHACDPYTELIFQQQLLDEIEVERLNTELALTRKVEDERSSSVKINGGLVAFDGHCAEEMTCSALS